MATSDMGTQIEDQTGVACLDEYRRAVESFTAPGLALAIETCTPTEIRISMTRDLGPCSRGKMTTCDDGHLQFIHNVAVDPSKSTAQAMLDMLSRCWVEMAIHEACEQIFIGEELYFDPHTQQGYERFVRIRSLPLRQRHDLAEPEVPQFGDVFHSHGRWYRDKSDVPARVPLLKRWGFTRREREGVDEFGFKIGETDASAAGYARST